MLSVRLFNVEIGRKQPIDGIFILSIQLLIRVSTLFWFILGYFISMVLNPFYPEYDSSRSYPFYPEYDSSRSLHLTRLPCTPDVLASNWLVNTEWRQYIGITRKPIFFNQSVPFFGYLQYKAGIPKLKWNQRWRRVAKTIKCWCILKDNSTNLLHTGDDKKADK